MRKKPENKKDFFLVENPLGGDDGDNFSGDFSTDKKSKSYSIKLFWGLIVLVLVGLFLRTSYLQLIKGNYYQKIADSNRTRTSVIKAPRGIIKDRFGQVLARNVPGFEITYIPSFLPEGYSQRKKLLERIKKIVAVNEEKEKEFLEVESYDQRTYSLVGKITSQEAFQLIEQENLLAGIYITQSAKRLYENSSIFAHLIGYEGRVNEQDLEEHPDYLLIDDIGKSGLEKIYESRLRGKYGEERFEVDSRGKTKQALEKILPVKGNELILNIDGKLQEKMHQVLSKVLEENKDSTGAVGVAIDPGNGAVRAMVSLPGYDNNLFTGGISWDDYQQLIGDEKKPLLNRAVGGEYPPGSTFKLYLGAVALQEGIINKNTSVDCTGLIKVGSWKFPDWKVHGITDVKKAIAESCDVFFYAIGGGYDNISGLGMNKMKHYAEMFGYGKPTGIDLTGEQEGNIPDQNWKFKELGTKWYIGDDYHASIGQGFVTVTPLQVTLSTMAIANEGKLYKPRLADKFIDSISGKEDVIVPESLGEILIDQANFKVVKEGMRQTVTGEKGTGRPLNKLQVSSAGKTGTAQFNNNENTHSWYTSFAPYEQPQLAMTILIEGGGESYDWAVPATRDIYQWYFDWERGEKELSSETGDEGRETDW